MKKSRVVSLKNIGLTDFLKRNVIVLILCLLFLLGVILGTVLYVKNITVNTASEKWFADYISARSSGSFLFIAFNSFLYYSAISVLIFACGTSMLGVVLIPATIGYLGFRYGGMASYVYSIYSLKGIAYNAVIFIPPSAVFFVALFFASKHSVEFSLIISKLTLSKSLPKNLSAEFKLYCGKFIILLFLIIVSSLIDSGLCKGFIKFFEF